MHFLNPKIACRLLLSVFSLAVTEMMDAQELGDPSLSVSSLMVNKSGTYFVKVLDSSQDVLPLFNPEIKQELVNDEVKKFRKSGIVLCEKAFVSKTVLSLAHVYVIKIDPAISDIKRIVKFLQSHYAIEYVESVPEYESYFTPNDFLGVQYQLSLIQAEDAWDLSKGDADVIIAIVDDAIDINHEDLSQTLWKNPGEIDNDGIDNDLNGYIDDVYGWDAANFDNDVVNNAMSHGTHCAGIALAETNNNTGIASIGFGVSLMSVKIADDTTQALTGAYRGVEYAITAGADVISLSWGGGSYSTTYQLLFDLAYSNDIVCVAAAGNSNTSAWMYPASYNHVISVGATNSADAKSNFSNYGSKIDVMAPGSMIYSSEPLDSYGYKSGTSMACPLVSGLCGLMLSYSKGIKPDQVEACLKSSSENIDGLNPVYAGQLGAGRINAFEALKCLQSEPIADFEASLTTFCPGRAIQFSDESIGANMTNWEWTFAGGSPGSSTLSNPFVSYALTGVYPVKLKVTNAFGVDSIVKISYVTIEDPQATLSGSTSINQGQSAYLKVDFIGNPPFSFSYSDGTNSWNETGITQSPYYFSVSPAQSENYFLTAFSNAHCSGAFAGNAQIIVKTGTQDDNCDQETSGVHTFGGGQDDTPSGNVILMEDETSFVVGQTASYGQGGYDIFLMKLDTSGQELWTKTYGETSNEQAFGFIKSSSGDLIISGYTYASSSIGNVLVMRIDTSGNVIWDEQYDASGIGKSHSLEELDNGDLMVFGSLDVAASGNDDLQIIKVNSSGNQIWSKTIGGTNADICQSSVKISNERIILTGYTESFGQGNKDVFLMEIDSSGSLNWFKTYGDTSNESANKILLTDDGGYLLFGQTESKGAGLSDLLAMKLDSLGNVIWSNVYGTIAEEQGNSAFKIADGGFILVGNSNGINIGGNLDLLILKIDSLGSLHWSIGFGGSQLDEGIMGAERKDGALDIYGRTSSTGQGNFDLLRIEANACGDFCNGNIVSINQADVTFLEGSWVPNSVNVGFQANLNLVGSNVSMIIDTVCTPPTTCSNYPVFQKIVYEVQNEKIYRRSFALTKDGGMIFATNIPRNSTAYGDVSVKKIDLNGDLVWKKKFRTTGLYFSCLAIMEAEGGDIYFTGVERQSSGVNAPVAVTRLDANGDLIWSKRYNHTVGSWANSVGIYESASKSIIVSGYFRNTTGGLHYDQMVFGINPAGTLLWENSWGASANDRGTSSLMLPSKSMFHIGTTESFGIGLNDDVMITKTDSVGNWIWSKSFGSLGFEYSNCVVASNDPQYIYFSGRSNGFTGDGKVNDWILKMDTLGNVVWHKLLETKRSAFSVNEIVVNQEEELYLVSATELLGSTDMIVAKLDDNGNLLKSIVIGSSSNEEIGFSIKILPDNSIVTFGSNDSLSSGILHPWINRIDPCLENTCGGNLPISISDLTIPFINRTPTIFSLIITPSNLSVSEIAVQINTLDISCGTAPVIIDTCAVIADFTVSDTLVCQKDTIYCSNLSSGAFTYKWIVNGILKDSTPSFKYPLDNAAPYDITLVTVRDSCSDSKTIRVNALPKPVLSISPGDTIICNQDTIQLSVLGAITYSWTPSGNLSCSNCTAPICYPGPSETYFVTGTDSNGCFSIDSVNVQISCCIAGIPGPYANFETLDSIHCEKDSVQFINTSYASSGATFIWYFTEGASPVDTFLGTTPPKITFNKDSMYMIKLIVLDSCGTDTIIQPLGIFPKPEPNLSDISLCYADTIPLGLESIEFMNYTWQPSQGIIVGETGDISAFVDHTDTSIKYTLQIEDVFTGCTGIDSFQFTVTGPPIATITLDGYNTDGNALLSGCCGTNYDWSNGVLFSDSTLQYTSANIIETTQIYLETWDTIGCISFDSLEVEFNRFIPNIITPNDDDMNTYFVVSGISVNRMIIYNRWGKEVYESYDYKNDWDAENNPDGWYYYVIYSGSEKIKGWIQVVR